MEILFLLVLSSIGYDQQPPVSNRHPSARTLSSIQLYLVYDEVVLEPLAVNNQKEVANMQLKGNCSDIHHMVLHNLHFKESINRLVFWIKCLFIPLGF